MAPRHNGEVRILVTNDDGIDSPGLHALAAAAADFGTVMIAAPAVESSGTSAGLTAARDDRRVAVEERDGGLAVAAHPGLIALIACHGGFGPAPDVVLSGVNRGANVGRAVLHSGTVGAALTASVNGARALAVSLDVQLDDPGGARTGPPRRLSSPSCCHGCWPPIRAACST